MLCGDATLVKTGDNGGVAVTLRCRAWNCDLCRPVRRRALIDLAAGGTPNRLLTLTVNPRVGVSAADRARRLADAWRVVVRRARLRAPGQTFDYLAVFEATKRGEPHLHILLRSPFISQAWLSEQMRSLLNSPIVDIRKIKGVRQAALYIAKYIGKAPHRFATCKRYWHTRNWVGKDAVPEREDPVPDGTWAVDTVSLAMVIETWRLNQWEVILDGEDRARYVIPTWHHHYDGGRLR